MSRYRPPAPNNFEKALSYVAPGYASNRYKSRVQFDAASHYAASHSRRATQEWTVSKGYDPDSDLFGERLDMVYRSRDLIRNNPLACGAIKTKVTSVIGPGLNFEARVDGEVLGMSTEQADEWNNNTEREFNAYFNTIQCDLERTLNRGQLEALAFRSKLENGDVIVLLPRVKRLGDVYSLKIQLVESDRLCNKDSQANESNLFDGVKYDERTGEPVEYHISKTHPNKLYSTAGMEWDVIPAYGAKSGRRNVLHIFAKNRIGQHRGIPDLAPAVELFKQLGNYTDAEVMAAVVSSMFTVFIKGGPDDINPLAPMQPDGEIGGKISDDDYKLGSGAMLELAHDEEVEFANPLRPNTSFDNFVIAILRQVGVSLELPFEVLVKHFTASYSASRAAFVMAYQYFLSERISFVNSFCKPIYEEWLRDAILLGRVDAPGFEFDPVIRAAYCNSEWIGPSMPQIDEGKEVKASLDRVDGNLSTLSTEIAKHGGRDWQGVLKQRAKEKKMQTELGVEPITKNTPPAAPAPESDDQKEDETNAE